MVSKCLEHYWRFEFRLLSDSWSNELPMQYHVLCITESIWPTITESRHIWGVIGTLKRKVSGISASDSEILLDGNETFFLDLSDEYLMQSIILVVNLNDSRSCRHGVPRLFHNGVWSAYPTHRNMPVVPYLANRVNTVSRKYNIWWATVSPLKYVGISVFNFHFTKSSFHCPVLNLCGLNFKTENKNR